MGLFDDDDEQTTTKPQIISNKINDSVSTKASNKRSSIKHFKPNSQQLRKLRHYLVTKGYGLCGCFASTGLSSDQILEILERLK